MPFYPLEVLAIRQDTRDAVVVTLAAKPEDQSKFSFVQGQYLTFRRQFDGEEIRRSYSICAGLDDDQLRVGIKRVEGGLFSSWANTELQVGNILEVMPPSGRFHAAIEPASRQHYLGFAGGSGITPVLSIIKTVLKREPHSRFTLAYANRSFHSIMFREELEDLKNTYLGRFSVIHVLEHDVQDIDLFTGRIDEQKCADLFKSWVDIKSVTTAFICGPEPMMLGIVAALKAHGLDDDNIKYELFASPRKPGEQAVYNASARGDGSLAKDSVVDSVCQAKITLDGSTRSIEIKRPGETVLEAALAANLDAPFACKAGVCSSCRAMVLEGEVEMETNHALEDYEVERGYVLTCQCFPVSESLVLDYDQ